MISALRKLTLKKFCSNCVMLAGAITALTGAAKSVVDVVPKSCMARMEDTPAPVALEDAEIRKRLGRIGRGPASVDALPPPPPEILYMKEDKTVWLIGPALLLFGLGFILAGRKIAPKAEQVVKEVGKV